MNMINKLLVFAISATLFFACQESDEMDTTAFTDTDELSVVSGASLPESVEAFINTNFVGELIVSTNALVSTTGIDAYETLLSSELNLVFDEEGVLVDFAEDSSTVNCDSKHKRKRGGKGGRGGKERPDMGDSTRTERPIPTEITVEELPTAAQDYLTANYPDSTVLKVLLKVTREDESIYKVLIANVGALIFDAEGTFIELFQRGGGSCTLFEELAIENLPETIAAYIVENYSGVEVLKARIGTIEDVVHILVSLADTGVLVFDEAGTFIEVKSCGMRK